MIILGRLVGPYGVRGWFNLHPFADDPAAWCALPQWWLAPAADLPEDRWQTMAVEDVRAHGKGLIVKLEPVSDRTAAEAMQGWYVAAPRDAMPATEEDEFYWDDLIGLDVVNAKGVMLGQVTEVLAAAANDVLVVQDGENKRLLPFVDEIVTEVDATKRRICVNWEADW